MSHSREQEVAEAVELSRQLDAVCEGHSVHVVTSTLIAQLVDTCQRARYPMPDVLAKVALMWRSALKARGQCR